MSKELKDEFISTVKNLKGDEKLEFLRWIAKTWNLKDLLNGDDGSNEEVLEEIAEEIRSTVPLTGILPSEVLYEPKEVNKEEKDTTLHVDEFLFSDEVVDQLVEDEKLSRHYCSDCGSRNIKPLTLISHSCSIERMRYIFTTLLPPMKGKTFLDVGSRLGAVLYGAYLYTDAKKIIGVEMNRDWCKLVEKIVNTRNMQDRIDVICSDVRDHPDLMSSADVILVSNAFEYFADKTVAEDCWKFIARCVKPGAILILSPRAERTFELYDIGFKWADWLVELPPYDDDGSSEADEFSETMATYRVNQCLIQSEPTS